MHKISKEGVAASSATYRKVTSEIAKRLKVKAYHTQFPSEDFVKIANLIGEKSKERALQFYELGLRRGLRKATDWFADGTIHYKDGEVEAPAILKVKVKIKFSGSGWQKHSFGIKTKDIGFR